MFDMQQLFFSGVSKTGIFNIFWYNFPKVIFRLNNKVKNSVISKTFEEKAVGHFSALSQIIFLTRSEKLKVEEILQEGFALFVKLFLFSLK